VNGRVAGAIGGLTALVALFAWTIAGSRADHPPRGPGDRPRLALLTSLPLLFDEEFRLEGSGSKSLTRLEQRYHVQPIAVADAASLAGHRLLLLAHPRAQPAEVLVELDRWVRQGGRVLLLADPKLDWQSKRPLGDRLRPPPGFADTGLLVRWGMTLTGPEPAGPARAGNGDFEVLTSAPGRLESRSCSLAGGGFVARCRIGKGRATVIADADFLDVEASGEDENLELLIDELARLESR
jgi:hypothetical protein